LDDDTIEADRGDDVDPWEEKEEVEGIMEAAAVNLLVVIPISLILRLCTYTRS